MVVAKVSFFVENLVVPCNVATNAVLCYGFVHIEHDKVAFA